MRALAEWLDIAVCLARAPHAESGRPKCRLARLVALMPEQLPTLLFLVALAAMAHHHKWFEPLTSQTMRVVHRVEGNHLLWAKLNRGLRLNWADQPGNLPYALPASGPKASAASPQPPTVTILRITPEGFNTEFCGLTPVPREAIARMLTAVAEVLSKVEEKRPLFKKPVIGIDVEIAEAAKGPRQAAHCPDDNSLLAERSPGDVEDAVRRLSKHATVVALAFRRTIEKDIESRNRSMSRLCKPSFDVLFATPNSFVDPGDPHYRFLRDGKNAASVCWPTRYPSLGNVMAAAAECSFGDKKCLGRTTSTYFCDAVKKSPDAPVELLGDEVERPYKIEDHYQWEYLDLLRSTVRAEAIAVDSLTTLRSLVEEETSRWREERTGNVRPMLMLSIDDGSTDRHFTVRDWIGTSGGDFIQAATALSSIEPLKDEELWRADLFDLVVGFAFLSIWTRVAAFAHRRLGRRGSHFAEAATIGLGPLAVAGGLSVVTLVWVAGRLHELEWVDPLLILIGLTMHTYLTMWEAAVKHPSQGSERHRLGIDRHFECAWSLIKLLAIGYAVFLVLHGILDWRPTSATRMTCAGLKTWSCGNNDGSVPCKLDRVADGSKVDVDSTPRASV